MSVSAPKTLWRWLHTPEAGSMKGAMVPIGWAAYNGVWMSVLAGFGTHNAQIVWLYMAAMGIITIFGVAVFIHKARHPIDPTRHRVPLRADAGVCLAFGIVFVGLGVIFGAWWYPFAGIFTIEAIWLAVKDYLELHRLKPKSRLQ